MASVLSRFWSKVDVRGPDECWEWQGSKREKGYGLLFLRGNRVDSAHRVSWELHNGREVPEGMVVRHTCDNPSCVNPAHLQVGTYADNLQDGIERGRVKPRRGTPFSKEHKPPGTKLTEEKVRQIRSRYAQRAKPKTLAAEYGVSKRTIHNIVKRKIWAHLD
jgi:hypothetical protein